jgi:SpoVK/Ycf46/Vps4 family AAA+-type ATPase
VDAPAGIMIVGMPGCGKSLMAKTIAKEFEIPLLKLDVGRLMGKYVGESEGNLHRAISVAEAAAPCVLWIDEIEKAFSGIGDEGGGGSSMTRMFGIFLTWMQEKTSNIYVVATANNIDKLPPEFLRRGRFDEIFQVKYPDAAERRQILELHIRRRNNNELPDGLAEVLHELKNAENYSGADIESIVKEAMKQVFNHNVNIYGLNKRDQWEKISSDVLTSVIKETRSSYHSQKEKLDKMMRKLNELDAKSAS